MTPALPAPRRFGPLRDKHSRPYLITAGLSMMGDNIEHVITYWVLWQVFASPWLVGFQLISHWLPFLLFSVVFGGLAEKYDCRRLIQIAQLLFAFVSLSWGLLFLTGTLEMWSACVLLVLHGCAGALWGPAEQLMLHDFATPEELPSAVRLNATFKSLGVLAGPVVGSALMLLLGTIWGIFANILFYLPMTLLMLRTPFTGHTRSGYVRRERISILDTPRVLGTVRRDPVLVGMIALAGLIAVCMGTSLQVVMPSIVDGLGAGDEGGLGYGALLFANGVGGVVGGILIEATGVLRVEVRSAVLAAIVYGLTSIIAVTSGSYAVVLTALVIGGVANLAATAVGQALVQIRAPEEQRGRVVGAYSMIGSGMRTGNGLTLGAIGTVLGVGGAVAVGGIGLIAGTVLIAALIALQARRGSAA